VRGVILLPPLCQLMATTETSLPFYLLRKLHPDRFLSGYFDSPCQCHSTNATYSYASYCYCNQQDKRKVGKLYTKQCSSGYRSALKRKHFHFYSWVLALISTSIFSEVASTVSVYFTKYAFNLNCNWFMRADSKFIQMLNTEWRASMTLTKKSFSQTTTIYSMM